MIFIPHEVVMHPCRIDFDIDRWKVGLYAQNPKEHVTCAADGRRQAGSAQHCCAAR
jgi:hypothetical protein